MCAVGMHGPTATARKGKATDRRTWLDVSRLLRDAEEYASVLPPLLRSGLRVPGRPRMCEALAIICVFALYEMIQSMICFEGMGR